MWIFSFLKSKKNFRKFHDRKSLISILKSQNKDGRHTFRIDKINTTKNITFSNRFSKLDQNNGTADRLIVATTFYQTILKYVLQHRKNLLDVALFEEILITRWIDCCQKSPASRRLLYLWRHIDYISEF